MQVRLLVKWPREPYKHALFFHCNRATVVRRRAVVKDAIQDNLRACLQPRNTFCESVPSTLQRGSGPHWGGVYLAANLVGGMGLLWLMRGMGLAG